MMDDADLTRLREDVAADIWHGPGREMVRALLDHIAALTARAETAEAKVQRACAEVDSVHQFHGEQCLCGFTSARSRSRTEHITQAVRAALAAPAQTERDPTTTPTGEAMPATTIERPYCLRCEKPIYQDEDGTWRREATGVAQCLRNPAGDGHEPLTAPAQTEGDDRCGGSCGDPEPHGLHYEPLA